MGDALGVSGVGGTGDRKVILLSPTTLGVIAPYASTIRVVGGKRVGMPNRKRGAGMKEGAPSGIGRLCLWCGVGVCVSMSGILGPLRGLPWGGTGYLLVV